MVDPPNTRQWRLVFQHSSIEDFQGLGRIGNAQDEQPLFDVCWSRAVAILDIHFGLRELMRNARKLAGFIAGFDHNNVVFHYQRAMFLKDMEGFEIIAHDPPNDTMIHRIAGSNSVDVYFDLG